MSSGDVDNPAGFCNATAFLSSNFTAAAAYPNATGPCAAHLLAAANAACVGESSCTLDLADFAECDTFEGFSSAAVRAECGAPAGAFDPLTLVLISIVASISMGYIISSAWIVAVLRWVVAPRDKGWPCAQPIEDDALAQLRKDAGGYGAGGTMLVTLRDSNAI